MSKNRYGAAMALIRLAHEAMGDAVTELSHTDNHEFIQEAAAITQQLQAFHIKGISYVEKSVKESP